MRYRETQTRGQAASDAERGQNATLFVACFNWLSRLDTTFKTFADRVQNRVYFENQNAASLASPHEEGGAVTDPDEKRPAKRYRSIITIKRTDRTAHRRQAAYYCKES